jgi:hypothetical protein
MLIIDLWISGFSTARTVSRNAAKSPRQRPAIAGQRALMIGDTRERPLASAKPGDCAPQAEPRVGAAESRSYSTISAGKTCSLPMRRGDDRDCSVQRSADSRTKGESRCIVAIAAPE